VVDVKNVLARYNRVEQEVIFQKRKQAEEAVTCTTAIGRLTEEELLFAAKFSPSITLARKYTSEQVIANREGEFQVIRQMFESLVNHMNQGLEYYENLLG